VIRRLVADFQQIVKDTEELLAGTAAHPAGWCWRTRPSTTSWWRSTRLQSQLGAELPWETDMAGWFPVWDIPL